LWSHFFSSNKESNPLHSVQFHFFSLLPHSLSFLFFSSMSGAQPHNSKTKSKPAVTVSFDITVGDNWVVDKRLPGVKWMLVTGSNDELLLNPSLCYQFIGKVNELDPPCIQFTAAYFYAISKDPTINDTRERELKNLLLRPVTQNDGHYLVNGQTPIRKSNWPHIKQIHVKATINVFRFDYAADPSSSSPSTSWFSWFICNSACFSRLWLTYLQFVGAPRTRVRVTLDDMNV